MRVLLFLAYYCTVYRWSIYNVWQLLYAYFALEKQPYNAMQNGSCIWSKLKPHPISDNTPLIGRYTVYRGMITL